LIEVFFLVVRLFGDQDKSLRGHLMFNHMLGCSRVLDAFSV